ncbi:MAG: double-strand break repair protein AddB [Hyphomicrobiaceae bacterium]|nr:double-strand break repair protein AddB [Hyphomicrobiaceae bacterium]
MTRAAASSHDRRVYTIPAGLPFMETLARSLLAGELPDAGVGRPGPIALSDTTLLLPGRGLVSALQAAFTKAGGGRPLLLPRIKAIAETETDLDVLTSAEDIAHSAATGAKPVVGRLERQLVLSALVLRWARQTGRGTTPAQAAHLAKELALLMDMLESHGLAPEALEKVVPEELSEHWKETLLFLRIIAEWWPHHLAERGVISPVEHRHRILRAEAARLAASPPAAPVVLAGVTALDPAALALAKAVLALPNGALVLPALDLNCDAATWAAIVPRHPEHPQFGLARMLADLGVDRGEVRVLAGANEPAPARLRTGFANEAMRPAETTEHWRAYVERARKKDLRAALAGIGLVEAATAEEEAEAVALMLREAVETPGRSAALVTPDPRLARRVSVRLRAWGMSVPVSAGTPFMETPSGAFLDLVINAAAHGFAPRAVADLSKHPMFRAGLPESEVRAGTRALELAVLRQPYFGQGLEGLGDALAAARISDKRRHPAVTRLSQADWEAAEALVAALKLAFRPLAQLFATREARPLGALVRGHTNAAQQLTPAEGLWFGRAGEWGSKFFAKLMDEDLVAPEVAAEDYPELYRALVAQKSLRIDGPEHPRIAIRDPFEARLQLPDLVILGGLNEGTWPAGAEPGPWLSRPMRATLGLPSPEERIGEAAHGFASLLGAPNVMLTRAAKVDGAPTVPSRWLLRLEALRKGLEAPHAAEPWTHWARARNRVPRQVQVTAPPAPRPAVELRPRKLSVTAVEKWFANPYALYAQRILRLEPLPPLGLEPGASLRGEIVHEALGRFARQFPGAMPEDAAGALIEIAEGMLAELRASPRVVAFWVPRLARFAQWFAETEPERRRGMHSHHAEIDGSMVLDVAGKPFTLTARADRIDARAIGGRLALTITDYKSAAGIAALALRAQRGLAPQLPLEAAIALAGGFTGLGHADAAPLVDELRYISASGGEPPGQEVCLKLGDVAATAREMQRGLEAMIGEFDKPDTPYAAVRRARFTYDYDDYAHLARVAEWFGDLAEETTP